MLNNFFTDFANTLPPAFYVLILFLFVKLVFAKRTENNMRRKREESVGGFFFMTLALLLLVFASFVLFNTLGSIFN